MRIPVQITTMPAKEAYLASNSPTTLVGVPELLIGNATLSPNEWPTGQPTFVASLDQERYPLVDEWNRAVREIYRESQTGG